MAPIRVFHSRPITEEITQCEDDARHDVEHVHTHTQWLNYAMKVLNATDADSGESLVFNEFTVIPELFLPSSVQTRTSPWRISPQTTCRSLLPFWPSPQPAKYKQPDK